MGTALRAAGVGAPARGRARARARGPPDAGRRPLRRPRLPDEPRSRPPVAHGPLPPPRVLARDGLLRRAGGDDLPAHGPAAAAAAGELVRPGDVLERRPHRARAAVRPLG